MLPVPYSCFKLPPFLFPIPCVMILIVPPIDGMAILVAPSPRCTCIVAVIASNPNQFDQYTHPFSMSFTGTPSIITPTFRWSNPRTLIRASPSPPPDCVAYTPAVPFNNIGKSLEPNSSWIFWVLILVTAMGTGPSFTTLPMTRTSSNSKLPDMLKLTTCSDLKIFTSFTTVSKEIRVTVNR